MHTFEVDSMEPINLYGRCIRRARRPSQGGHGIVIARETYREAPQPRSPAEDSARESKAGGTVLCERI